MLKWQDRTAVICSTDDDMSALFVRRTEQQQRRHWMPTALAVTASCWSKWRRNRQMPTLAPCIDCLANYTSSTSQAPRTTDGRATADFG